MNLALGCREKTEDGWIYYLRDSTPLSKEQWTKLVEDQIKINKDQDMISQIMQQATIWNEDDTAYDMALQIYASRLCTQVLADITEMKVKKISQCVHKEKSTNKINTNRTEQTGQLSFGI